MFRQTLARSTPVFALVPVLLVAFSMATALEGSCVFTRPPERDLWIEVLSCSDQVQKAVTDELFLQALGRTGSSITRDTAQEAAGLLRENPGLLIVAREVAFADSALPYTVHEPSGKFSTRVSERPGKWQSSGGRPDRRYFLGSARATCEEVGGPGRLVVREVVRCCDTPAESALGCILGVAELVPSDKAPPTIDELAPRTSD